MVLSPISSSNACTIKALIISPITKVSLDSKSPFQSPYNYHFAFIYIGKFAAVFILLINSPMESHQCIFPVRGPREGAVGKQFSPSQRMRPSRNSIQIRWLELYSFHEANVRRGCIIIRGNQQCLAESLFGGRQGSTGTHRHGETPHGTLGSHGNQLLAPSLHHPSPAGVPRVSKGAQHTLTASL